MKLIKTILILLFAVFFFKISAVYGQSEFTFCDYVDESWNPVGASPVMKSSAGMNFLVKMQEKMTNQNYAWVIYRTDASGKDAEWVNELILTIDDQVCITSGCRFFCTTEKTYLKSGSYRVYFIIENDKEPNYKSGNLSKYLCKGEVTVQ